MSLVRNVIEQCKNANSFELKAHDLRYLVVHRTDLSRFDAEANPNPVSDYLLDGPSLAMRFKNKGLGTGGSTPYHFLVCVGGEVDQMLPLNRCGAHAVGYNHQSIAIAVVGSKLLKQPPTTEQANSLVRLLATLLPLNGGLRIVGHTELPGGSRDPNKVCPGPFLATGDLSKRASALIPIGADEANARAAMLALGILSAW